MTPLGKRELKVAGWSFLWPTVVTLGVPSGGTDTVETAAIFVFLHTVGVLYLGRPWRRPIETILVCAAAGLSFAIARYAALTIRGLAFESVFVLGWFIVVAAVADWILLSAVALVSSWIYNRVSKMPYLGNCLRCKYDLRGNMTGVCPECGLKIMPDQQKYLSKIGT